MHDYAFPHSTLPIAAREFRFPIDMSSNEHEKTALVGPPRKLARYRLKAEMML